MTKEQETKVLELYKQGLSNRTIAKKTDIHHRTVAAILTKNNLKSHKKGPIPANYVGDKNIKCSKCGLIKYQEEFRLCRKNKPYPYRLSYCELCRRLQVLNNMNSDPMKVLRDIYLRLTQRCKKRNIIINIDYEYLVEIYRKQQGKCFYSNEILTLLRGRGPQRFSCSVDKIIPEKGYVIGNIVLCTKRYNTIKSDLSLKEIEIHMPKWYNKLINTDWITI